MSPVARAQTVSFYEFSLADVRTGTSYYYFWIALTSLVQVRFLISKQINLSHILNSHAASMCQRITGFVHNILLILKIKVNKVN